jgi:uncharacterized protein YjiS (DUF1127 family)
MVPHPSTPWLYVSRPLWLRLGQALIAGTHSMAAAWPQLKTWTTARRRLDQERSALGHLSPHLLRDVGASPEVIAEAHQAETLRAMRLEAHRW